MSSSCQQFTRAATEATQTTISKDFPPIEKLPNRPLKISDLLGIFAAIKGIKSDLSSGKRRCQAAIVQQIAAEIVLLYGKIGLQPVARSRTIVDKILRAKKKYYDWVKLQGKRSATVGEK